MKTAYIIAGAFILDSLIGDPQNPLHPMRIIGGGISSGVAAYRKVREKFSPRPALQFAAGAALALVTVSLSYAITSVITRGFYGFDYWAGLAAESVICYFLIAAKALNDESMKVCRSLAEGDAERARRELSLIVGRDTRNLSEPDIVRAAVETVAENLSDGVVAPLIFIFIGGAPLGMAYKAVNTLDSMIGYRNADFEYFGKFSARLDDAANFIPSRISALLMIAASAFVRGADARGAWRIFMRDRHNHKSPNSAQTEAACAGALGLRLGGDNYYNGTLVRKPTIGDGRDAPAPAHIIAANRLMYASAVGAAGLLVAVSCCV